MAGSKQNLHQYDLTRDSARRPDNRNRTSTHSNLQQNFHSPLGGLNFGSAPPVRPNHREQSRPYGYEDGYRHGADLGNSERNEIENDQTENGQATEREAKYNSGYIVVPPNEQKRTKLLQQAERNMQQFEQMKRENAMKYNRDTPSATGGPGLSRDELLRRREESQKQAEALSRRQALERQKKREQWAAEKRNKEEQEINERKMRARQQTERNEEKERREHMERKAKMDDERRRKNLQFFERKFKDKM